MLNSEDNGNPRVRVADPQIIEAAKDLLKRKMLKCDFCEEPAMGWEFSLDKTKYMWVACHAHLLHMGRERRYGRWSKPSPYKLRVRFLNGGTREYTCVG